MAIAKRPAKQTADTEAAAAAFISKAGKALPANGKTPVLFRFKNDFLERIDAAARKQELPRQAWVRTVIAEALEAKGL
jgi:hypothetical protein